MSRKMIEYEVADGKISTIDGYSVGGGNEVPTEFKQVSLRDMFGDTRNPWYLTPGKTYKVGDTAGRAGYLGNWENNTMYIGMWGYNPIYNPNESTPEEATGPLFYVNIQLGQLTGQHKPSVSAMIVCIREGKLISDENQMHYYNESAYTNLIRTKPLN